MPKTSRIAALRSGLNFKLVKNKPVIASKNERIRIRCRRARRRAGISGEARSAFGTGWTLRLAATGKVGHKASTEHFQRIRVPTRNYLEGVRPKAGGNRA